MSDDTKAFLLFISVALSCLGGCITGCSSGYRDASSFYQKQAVERGVGEYYIDDKLQVQFRWTIQPKNKDK